MARDEIVWMVLLVGSAILVLWNFTPQNEEALIWSAAVFVQALPFIAALVTSMCNALPKLFTGRSEPMTLPAGSATSAAE